MRKLLSRTACGSVLVALGALGAHLAVAEGPTSNGPLEIRVTSAGGASPSLDVQLVWHGKEAIEIPRASLPWEDRYSLLLIAATTDGEILEPALPVEDGGYQTAKLSPRVVLSGRIDLDDRFPSLRSELKSRDVLIFWSYQLRPLRREALERLGGWLLLRGGTSR